MLDGHDQIHLELYAGTGDLAVRSFQGLQASVTKITDDPYVSALSPRVGGDTTDKEKVSQVLLAASQLVAYLEGQTGLVGIGGRGSASGNFSVQTAPSINLNAISGLSPGGADKVVDMAARAMKGKKAEEEEKPKSE